MQQNMTHAGGDLLDKSEYSSVPFKEKKKPANSWTVPLVTGHKYRFSIGQTGMNFENMPELDEHLAYPITLGAMVLIGLGMLSFFVWRGWLK